MKPNGYLVFHLNLAFSSIEEESRVNVIKSCYNPLLDLIEKAGFPIGVELTGWTLQQIQKIDKTWIERFKSLLSSNKCELIGSGYSQIIGPLVPHNVNMWNQKLGIETYQKILNARPKIVLVNEMVFSSSLVDLYSQFDYKGFIMDRDNIKLALDTKKIPTHAQGSSDSEMAVLWSDSILFQKMQHYAHGDISINHYLNYINNRINDGEKLLPIYSNDAEIFDYRPGRFNEESATHFEGEWKRIEKLLKSLVSEAKINFVSPSRALEIILETKEKVTLKIVNAAYPIPVKKQAKYNIARWAVTGRSDLWINTMCNRIQNHLVESNNSNPSDWQELCELWSSDLRTHISDKRWIKGKSQFEKVLSKHNINFEFKYDLKESYPYDSLANSLGKHGNYLITLDNEKIILSITSKNIKLELNLRRGLAIQSLSFKAHQMLPCIGTIPHGYFPSISFGADFYSGSSVIELPLLRRKITDLEKVDPNFYLKDDGGIEIRAEVKTQFGTIVKVIEISANKEKVCLSYSFINWDKVLGSVRLGAITLLNQFSNSNTKLYCNNGGEKFEKFSYDGDFNHGLPATTFVSSSRGLGATSGEIKISNQSKSLSLKWNPGECAAMPMLQNSKFEGKTLSRVFFSTQELDDTVKEKVSIMPFKFVISPF
jgi:hypothetical protein